jgi:hypothetical protein
MALQTFDPVLNPIERLPCRRCSTFMRLSRIEPTDNLITTSARSCVPSATTACPKS